MRQELSRINSKVWVQPAEEVTSAGCDGRPSAAQPWTHPFEMGQGFSNAEKNLSEMGSVYPFLGSFTSLLPAGKTALT